MARPHSTVRQFDMIHRSRNIYSRLSWHGLSILHLPTLQWWIFIITDDYGSKGSNYGSNNLVPIHLTMETYR